MPKLVSPLKARPRPKVARRAKEAADRVVQRSSSVRPVVIGGSAVDEAARREAARVAASAAESVRRSAHVAGQMAERARLQHEDDRALGRGRGAIPRPRRGR